MKRSSLIAAVVSLAAAVVARPSRAAAAQPAESIPVLRVPGTTIALDMATVSAVKMENNAQGEGVTLGLTFTDNAARDRFVREVWLSPFDADQWLCSRNGDVIYRIEAT